MFVFIIISLYQLGIIQKTPNLPGKFLDSKKDNSSKYVYIMGLPDGPICLVHYGLNIVFASAGGTKKPGRHTIFDLLPGGIIISTVGGNINIYAQHDF
ncbi:hypothetical protein PZB74_00495 [Porifericola rhodea]|uniref:hypothetical protein n=1 Tax=Porifericola rhodea TaxID=930972 RepID=UPI002665AE8C|nr:hypothetical protein [Porifericola rhodea]WKN31837.1 hypothetical protein PZB74_00495 [Porifericola rhodea]